MFRKYAKDLWIAAGVTAIFTMLYRMHLRMRGIVKRVHASPDLFHGSFQTEDIKAPQSTLPDTLSEPEENDHLSSAVESVKLIGDPVLRAIVDYAWLIALTSILGASLTESLIIFGERWSVELYFLHLVNRQDLLIFSNLTSFLGTLVFKMICVRLETMLRKLWDVGSIRKQDRNAYVHYILKLERQLNSRWSIPISLSFMGLLSIYYFKLFDGMALNDITLSMIETVAFLALAFFFVSAGILWVYAAGAVSWRVTVIALGIRRLGSDFNLRIQPSHPDRCGGMKSVGELVLSIALLIIVCALFLSHDVLKFQLAGGTDDPNYLFAMIGLLIVAGLSTVVFFWPLHTIHSEMLAFKAQYQRMLDVSYQRIGAWELTLLTYRAHGEKIAPVSGESAENLAQLTNFYNAVYEVPSWPFDRPMFLKFLGLEAITLLTMLGIVADVITLWDFLSASAG